MKKVFYFRFILLLTLFIAILSGVCNATERTFNKGSLIIPVDSCWQPNNDPSSLTPASYCDTNKNDRSLFQLFGMLYAIVDTGDQPDKCINNDGSAPLQKLLFGYCKQIKVYWIIDNAKADSQAPDLVLSTTDASINPIVTIYNSAKTGAGNSTTPVPYKGGPFVIDVNDITTTELNIIKSKFPSVKIHKANIPFSGNVDKVLIGKPPKIAVLNEGASDVLEDYIRAAGTFAWRNVVFQYVNARDVLAGCLQDPVPSSCKARRPDITAPFQLLWAPHWIVENKWADGTTPTVTEQQDVIKEIRAFLERGNSGFFECASIESMESSISADGTKQAGINIGSAGGFLISSSNATPRLETNGGCSDLGKCASDYVKYEAAPFWLTQCGGWKYNATGGHVHNMRPRKVSNYTYLTTKTTDDSTTTPDDRYIGSQLTRFIHDDATKLNSAYDPGSSQYYLYDYLVGGRINGSPTQGYVVYFPGHKFIKCNNATTFTYPPSRALKFQFDSVPPESSLITIEVVYSGCTHNSTCPKVTFDMTSGKGTRVSDSKIDLSAEFAYFDSDTNTLNGVFFSSNFTESVATQLQITDIYVSVNTAKLLNVVDLTDISNRQSLCAPNTTGNDIRCSIYNPRTRFSLFFNGPIDMDVSKIVTVTLTMSDNTTVSATYNLDTNVGTTSTSGNITLDLTGATYNAENYSLENIYVKRGSTCADVVLKDITVKFPGTSNLSSIYDNTVDSEICTPNAPSPTTCSGLTPPSTETSIATKLTFRNDYTSSTTNITLKLDYKCTSCSGTPTGSLLATFNASTKKGDVVNDAYIKIDMSQASLINSGKELANIKVINLDSSKTINITKVTVTFDTSKKLKAYIDTTNSNASIYVFSSSGTSTSPASSASISYQISSPPATSTSTWSYKILGTGICSYYISPYLSECQIDWNSSNTCGIKFVLNTSMALKYQSVTSEFFKSQPLVKDNILYKASYDYPIYRGHLKMIKVPTDTNSNPVTVWDAATTIPVAGTSNFPSSPLSSDDNTSPRFIFTTLPDSTNIIKFDPSSAATLKTYLGVATNNDAIVTINTVRGRKGASTSDVYSGTSGCVGPADGNIDLYGCDEDSKRLWAIENSTPALKIYSKLVESTEPAQDTSKISNGKDRRDRFLFAGADDGMLHAFFAGKYSDAEGGYPYNSSGNGNGKEIWAYIPSSLLPYLKDQPFNPNPADESSFEPKVSIDGSPAISDFLVYDEGTKTWKWKTYLVGTANIRAVNKGIVFALDITDPYDPKVLWEKSYDKTSDTGCSGTQRNCNMGNSKGVAIGTVQVTTQLKDYVFLTSSWINKRKPKTDNSGNIVVGSDGEIVWETCPSDQSGCVYGISAFALEITTGKVIWERAIPYTGDATNINVTPAVPALMDRDNNGSYDYLVFGDMQGRVWALRTTDGKNVTGAVTPVHTVKVLDSSGNDTSTPTGALEPIGASVSIYRDYIVIATGGADYASDLRKYRVEVLKLSINGATKLNDMTFVTEVGEKVWAKPAITEDLKIYIATAKNYFSSKAVATLESVGRIIVIDMRVQKTGTTSNITVIGGSTNWIAGGFVGGFDFDRKHAYIVALKPTKTVSGTTASIIQIGSKTSFSSTTKKINPYKVLWWRKM